MAARRNSTTAPAWSTHDPRLSPVERLNRGLLRGGVMWIAGDSIISRVAGPSAPRAAHSLRAWWAVSFPLQLPRTAPAAPRPGRRASGSGSAGRAPAAFAKRAGAGLASWPPTGPNVESAVSAFPARASRKRIKRCATCARRARPGYASTSRREPRAARPVSVTAGSATSHRAATRFLRHARLARRAAAGRVVRSWAFSTAAAASWEAIASSTRIVLRVQVALPTTARRRR